MIPPLRVGANIEILNEGMTSPIQATVLSSEEGWIEVDPHDGGPVVWLPVAWIRAVEVLRS